MNRIAVSAAASGLLRALIERAGIARSRLLLTDVESTEWQSLTFTGERHQIILRLPGPGSRQAADRLCNGLGDAEFSIAGQIVADIAIVEQPSVAPDGSITVAIEALTIADH